MSESVTPSSRRIWLNGRFVPEDRPAIHPLDRGFLYGDGLFETLRAQNGRPLYLSQHLDRLRQGAEELRLNLPGDLHWDGIIARLLQVNGLCKSAARVKIIVTRGQEPRLGLPTACRPTIILSAERYHPPTARDYLEGWRLHCHLNSYAPPLARYKSLNYLFYLCARQAALDAGCHEAVVLDPEGRVCETAAGSLLCRSGGTWWTPESPHQLTGITLQQVRRLLGLSGTPVDTRAARPADLRNVGTVWVLNALIGVMPAVQIDGRIIPDPLHDAADRIRGLLVAGN
ncbi:aminotransferase class IV [Desulfatiglans anilini]|uniref:aminotransferase class IV n=1 Tax=Desulfatiglans anilini TaxID=90728 RepID=UPI00048417ED|nr:aminotransferase class IV [Desulfatiglans anilini]